MKKFIITYWSHLLLVLLFASVLFFHRCSNVDAACITLAWDANTEENVVGYDIWRSIDQPGGYYSWIGTNDGINNIEFTWCDDILPGYNYYFVVTAFSNDDEESGYSNEVCAYINPGEEYAIECGTEYEGESEGGGGGGSGGCFINNILKEEDNGIRAER